MIEPTDKDVGRKIAYFGVWAEGGVIFGILTAPEGSGWLQAKVTLGEAQTKYGFSPEQSLQISREDLDWAD